MAFKLKSYVLVGTRIIPVDIYGYATRSIPGVDIVGLGSRGKLIREKINFITNQFRNKKSAAKRFVISVESELPEEKLKNLSSDLEFPILILYWSMATIIPLKNLEKCWATGSVNVDFEIKSPLLSNFYTNELGEIIEHQRVLITPKGELEKCSMSNDFTHILWEDLINVRNYSKSGFPSNEDD